MGGGQAASPTSVPPRPLEGSCVHVRTCGETLHCRQVPGDAEAAGKRPTEQPGSIGTRSLLPQTQGLEVHTRQDSTRLSIAQTHRESLRQGRRLCAPPGGPSAVAPVPHSHQSLHLSAPLHILTSPRGDGAALSLSLQLASAGAGRNTMDLAALTFQDKPSC